MITREEFSTCGNVNQALQRNADFTRQKHALFPVLDVSKILVQYQLMAKLGFRSVKSNWKRFWGKDRNPQPLIDIPPIKD